MKFSCIALAGGKSTRLGRNKLNEMIGGKTLLQYVLGTLSKFNTEIILVVSPQSVLPSLESYPQVRIVKDIYPGNGSLGGIFTGLLASSHHQNLVVACDMPFLKIDLLRYMIDISQDYDFVASHQDDRPEPLHAVYSRNCLVPMKYLLEHHQLRIVGILPHIKARYISPQEIQRFDPRRLSFFNINTEEDLITAKAIEESLTLKA